MAKVTRASAGSASGSARRLRPQPSHRDPRNGQFVHAGGGGGVERGEQTLGLVEAPDEAEAPGIEMARKRHVRPVAVRFDVAGAPIIVRWSVHRFS